MNFPTNEDWIDWARELAQSGHEESRSIVLESLNSVPNEIGMHWAPFALGMTPESLRNYIVNLEIVSAPDFEKAEANADSDFPSWFEVLQAANIAIDVDASEPYDFWDRTFRMFQHHYPDISQPCPRELHHGENRYHVAFGGDIVSMDNAFSDFLDGVDDARRTCWIKSSVLESQPIIFGVPLNVERLAKRLRLGTPTQMPRQNRRNQ